MSYTDLYSTPDSSLGMDARAMNSYYGGDYNIRIGIVREIVIPENPNGEKGDCLFIVDVRYRGRETTLECQQTYRFNSPHNFEEYSLRNWLKTSPDLLTPDSAGLYDYRAGEVVVVAALEGDYSQGVILASMRHPTRPRYTPVDGTIAYASRFNGLETEIKDDGAYKVTWRGAPTNTALLDLPPSPSQIPPPTFDDKIGGTFYGIDNTGSFWLSDNNSQYLYMNKDEENGKTQLISTDTSLTIDKENFTAISKNTAIDGEKTTIKAKEAINLDAKEVSLKGKISIGNDSVELLTVLAEFITELGNVVVNSPVGTCTPVNSSPNWAAIEQFKSKIEQITGGGPQEVEAKEPVKAPEDTFGDNMIT